MKRKKYEENKGITGKGTDYAVYRMSMTEKLICILAGSAGGISAFCIFFGTGIAAMAAGIAGGAAGLHFGGEFFRKKRDKALTEQFRNFLESLAASVQAGQNVPGAIETALGDMKQLYGEKAAIVNETALICAGMRNNISPEELFSDLAQRSGQKDIRTFADTFSVCNRSGGNMREIIMRTTRILSEKMQIEKETDVIASKGKNELMLMTLMPFVIIPMLHTLGENGVSGNSPVTVAVKTAGALIIAAAVFIGRKITDIRM